MQEKYVVKDLKAALTSKLFPTVTVWNRLEGRPRRDNFERALKAEVRDALWMLTKQWQIGEFAAEDAGSPMFAKLRLRSSPVTSYQAAGGTTEPLPDMPLEVKVEQKRIRWELDGHKMQLDLRAQLGRQWRRLLQRASLDSESQYLRLYPIQVPAPSRATDHIHGHRVGWQQYAALAGRCIDGGELYLHLTRQASHRASDGITLNAPGDKLMLDDLGDELRRWVDTMYNQPAHEDAWKPPYLEYQFACSGTQAGQEKVLAADQYAQGRLDWYSFDRAPHDGGIGGTPDPARTEEVSTASFIPTPVAFEGMPEPRWWAMEDRKTDFGSIKPSTTDLAHLLLMEFALVYANDWFLVPCSLPAGTLAAIEGMAVTNTFGERFWVTAAGSGSEQNWHRWAMFQLSSRSSSGAADTSLFIPPVATRTMDGDPIEEIELARDEVANMAWAIERIVPTVTGDGRSGKDEARETLQYHQRLVSAAPEDAPEYKAAIAYHSMTGVPENWIPLLPVHVTNSVREVQLQRGRMLRTIPRDPLGDQKVPPRTPIMREGLEETPKKAYFIHEEEVPRAGVRVAQSFRRTRWTDGGAFIWLGVQKQPGRGERSSGLAFDTLVDAKKDR